MKNLSRHVRASRRCSPAQDAYQTDGAGRELLQRQRFLAGEQKAGVAGCDGGARAEHAELPDQPEHRSQSRVAARFRARRAGVGAPPSSIGANKIIGYSTQYRIGADLATTILDVASAEGIDPELAFRLVKLESDFNPRAASPVGAIGLTQVMPATARYYVKGITAEGLYDPSTNLRVGFRYLRGLVTEYKGDVKLALLVYNRGPVAVQKAQAGGDNPSNGYDRILTKDTWARGRSSKAGPL